MIFTTEAHEAYRQKVREFAETVIKPEAERLDREELFSAELTKKMGQAGLFGITLPKEYGGQDLDTLSYIIAIEELSRVDASQAGTIAAHNSLGITPIFEYGTQEQKEKYLPKLTTGDHLWAFGLTEETAGSDARGTKTRGVKEADEWVINGSKRYITNSANELTLGVTLQVMTADENGKEKLTTILVEKDTPGFSSERMTGKMMWRASDTGRINLNNCRVPVTNTLGKEGQGARYMLKTLDAGRLSIAAMGVGLAQGAFEMALEHAHKREQFGQPIAKFQSISFKLADMDMKLELARNTLYKGCMLKEQGKPFAREAAIAKLYSSEIAREIADEAIQIFGGSGLFKENPIERFYRDQRILQIGEGTSEILRFVIARHLGIK
ncbi:acyl-CoA dehydrogenase family protein [Marinilabilia salmonicolor]|jgi:alkylation response protein AidB-like acyl-CoA dehydrogenase|uniref:Alkylation response protein AidB-like acyl-CoA dehydrogenase n=1 Tax=Marinilabilia salmonicolor TaxID=989 RepID=A0A2T0XMT4_9BACT|nr:acyl-CoA dehydrogenase family protein [Marinilabilia salmonicolor]PRZ00241.1 alkylation response protein AidB-like acyl-CoA dehydrogenase [Marinilabilia salmonicolor]RCW38306.1 alkylation response protein AidB-like acyl-CoA dehydrogenase [Marinilabilia salmonicolor]